MWDFFFTIDQKALWISIILLGLSYFIKRFFVSSQIPQLSFSFLQGLLSSSQPGRSAWLFLPYRLYQASLLFFILAFIDPHLMLSEKAFPSKQDNRLSKSQRTEPPPTEGIAIYLVLDQSGSMAEKIMTKGANGEEQSLRKIDLLKQVTAQFIQNESNNLIGIVAFARIPHVLVPLTLDQETLQKQLNKLGVVSHSDEDGTAIGYAIFKTANLIAATRHFAEDLQGKGKPAYEIKSAAIIVVTDGFQDPSLLDKGNRLRTMDLDEAAAYAKNQHIHVYLINVDPSISSPEFAPHRRQMQRITTMTGGKFYIVSNEGLNLQQVYTDIDKLEKGPLISATETDKSTLKAHYRRVSFYPFLIILGLLGLFGAIILETTLLRKVP